MKDNMHNYLKKKFILSYQVFLYHYGRLKTNLMVSNPYCLLFHHKPFFNISKTSIFKEVSMTGKKPYKHLWGLTSLANHQFYHGEQPQHIHYPMLIWPNNSHQILAWSITDFRCYAFFLWDQLVVLGTTEYTGKIYVSFTQETNIGKQHV